MAWKILFHSWLAMPLTAQQMADTPAQHQHLWQLGSFLPFSSFPLPSMVAPRRVIAYLEAFRQLYPHRLSSPADMSFTEVMGEPLFYNKQIRDQGEPAAWQHWARQGLVRMQHLRDFMHSGTACPTQQQQIQQLLQAMPGISQGDGLTRKLRRQQHRVARPAREAGDRVRNARKEGQLSCQGAPLLAQVPLGLECCDGCVLMLMENECR